MEEQVEMVGRAFVDHYYNCFDTNRTCLASLYQSSSMLTFEGQKFMGVDDIIGKMSQLPFDDCHHVISTIDTQPSAFAFAGAGAGAAGILIFVSGTIHLQGQDHPLRFSQMFHIIPTGEENFFVLNDIFRLNYG